MDPNRVLDIILESFEARPHLDKLFISLIKNYMGDAQVICEVLGFKLGDMEVLENCKSPPSLMTVIALLLQHEVISLDDIYPWVCIICEICILNSCIYLSLFIFNIQLRPDDTVMAKEADKEFKAVQDYIRRLNIVSTKGPQSNAPAEFIEEKADPQVHKKIKMLFLSVFLLHANNYYKILLTGILEQSKTSTL